VQQLIAQHVGQLTLEEQTLLEAASVAGMTFSVAALAAGVTMESAAIETQLTAWARQGRFVQAQGAEIWPDGVVSARYEFRHPNPKAHLYQFQKPNRPYRKAWGNISCPIP
jgi:hypothetical protein